MSSSFNTKRVKLGNCHPHDVYEECCRVAKWLSVRLEIEMSLARDSLVALCCVLEQHTLFSSPEFIKLFHTQLN